MTVGLDTGFFARLLAGNAEAKKVWSQISGHEISAVASCMSMYELQRLGLKGAIEQTTVNTIIEELPHVCRIVWLDSSSLIEQAARLGHGNGLAMADAIILTSLLEGEAEKIYTTDADFERYEAGPEITTM